MTHTTTNIHDVASAHIKVKGQLAGTKAYTTDITIRDESGGTIAFTLFHDGPLPITTELAS